MSKRTLFDRVLKLGVKAAVGTVLNELPVEFKDPAARRLIEREVEEAVRKNVGTVTQKVKQVTEKVKSARAKKRAAAVAVEEPPDLNTLKLKTACSVLGVKVPARGKKVDLERAAEARRELLKKHHPDAGGNREMFQAVNAAFDELEKYNR